MSGRTTAGCPWVAEAEVGLDDPGAAERGVALAIVRHIQRCEHAWCREQRGAS